MNLKMISPLFLALLLAGCKIEITVPEGGRVVTSSGAIAPCQSGQTCVVDVVDIFFDEEFVAIPAAGFRFEQWEKRHRGLCGGKPAPCRLFTSGFADNDALMSFLESEEEVFYLTPVFATGEDPGCRYNINLSSGSYRVCQVEHDEQSCSSIGGTLSASSCHDDSSFGRCSSANGEGDIYYSQGSPGEMFSHCDSIGGTWTAL